MLLKLAIRPRCYTLSKVWIYQGKLPPSQCLPQGPHKFREQYIQVALQWNLLDTLKRIKETNHIKTRNTCIAKPREARGGAHKGWEDRREMK